MDGKWVKTLNHVDEGIIISIEELKCALASHFTVVHYSVAVNGFNAAHKKQKAYIAILHNQHPTVTKRPALKLCQRLQIKSFMHLPQ